MNFLTMRSTVDSASAAYFPITVAPHEYILTKRDKSQAVTGESNIGEPQASPAR
jgi:hypothetical protein